MRTRADLKSYLQPYLTTCRATLNSMRLPVVFSLLTASGFSGTQALAMETGFLPSGNSTQQDLKSALNAEDFAKALKLWPTAAQGSVFAASANGEALYSYLLVKNDMPVAGLETLFSLSSSKGIDESLKKSAIQAFPAKLAAWKTAQITWTSDWSKAFPQASQNALAQKEFSLAVTEGIQSKNAEHARNRLQAIQKNTPDAIERGQMNIALARLFYQDRKFKEALETYKQIPKSSDYWLDGIEERAWTKVQLGEPEQALTDTQTILTPLFAAQAGSQPYFLATFSNLQICDYSSIFKRIQEFKTREKTRLEDLQKYTTQAYPRWVLTTLEENLSVRSLIIAEKEKMFLPRGIVTDSEMAKSIQTAKALHQESTKAASFGLGNVQAHLQDHLVTVEDQILKRLRLLAQDELGEASQTIRKLHLIQAEAVQHIYVQDKATTSTKSANVSGKERMTFPDDGEVWLDEIDSYQIRAKTCPSRKGKTS
jgi:hypothetical protein